MPFPKPPPVAPNSLEIWLGDTDRAEVGREAFFRGRDHEYGVFQNALNMLMYGRVGGGTMIFQGAPGAGKTALMQECMEAVRQHSTPQEPWIPVLVRPDMLGSAPAVIEAMMEATKQELERLDRVFPSRVYILRKLKNLLRGFSSFLSSRNYNVGARAGEIEISAQSELRNTQKSLNISAEAAFRNTASIFNNKHLVIFVDEAQNTPISESTKAVVSCLHEGVQGISLIAAFFGLSDTEGVLRQCDLSRPLRDRILTLETMSQEEAASAIQGVFDAYEFNGPDQATWVDELARLSQGWPQHINSVAVAAGQVIQKNGGSLQSDLLQQAVELGKEKKKQYYYTRLKACSGRVWVYKELAKVAGDSNGLLSWDEIDNISERMRNKMGLSTNDFLTDALHAGVLMESKSLPDYYKVPIPSFGDYLRELPL
ncbi:MAG: ATP-binding protein [Gammaproteobacteria bacterium]|nr:ATP-binding protein [Gammaproteobacteria bacterium]